MAKEQPEIVWWPQPGPQRDLINSDVFEVFYGGARGGGKTDAMLGEWGYHANEHGRDANGVFFRRELPQLEEAIERSKQIYGQLDAEFREQKRTWLFANGARLKFRPLARDPDAEKYQGHSYTRVYFEELTNYPSPVPVDKMKATLRSAAGVPCRFRATGNPGGPGHHWVKARYIDPAPDGMKVFTDDHGLGRLFIPARLTDNRILLDADPDYVARLRQSGSEQLVRAWLDGDWDILEGAFFDCWRADRHVLRPFAIPSAWMRFRAFDWGSARPFSVGWWAVSDGSLAAHPAGKLIRYREWYGASAPNVGLKLTAEQVADGITGRETGETIAYGVADPSIFSRDGGPSLAQRFSDRGVFWRPADNRRTPTVGHAGGWDQVRARLVGEDGKPMIGCFSTCRDSIRTIPALQHDSHRPEDVDTNGEDHAADEWRYACMSRPWVAARPAARRPDRWDRSFDRNEDGSWKTV